MSLFIGAGMADSAVSAKNGEFAFAEEVPAPGHDSGAKSIVVMNANGSGKTVLTHHFLTGANPALVNDSEPDWSPNGTEIAFTRSRQAPNAAAPTTGIEVMNADGTDQTRLTTNVAADSSPAWSPDGNEIVFASNRTGSGDIYAMNADGTAQRRLNDERSRRQLSRLVARRDEDRLREQAERQRRHLRAERRRDGPDSAHWKRPSAGHREPRHRHGRRTGRRSPSWV